MSFPSAKDAGQVARGNYVRAMYQALAAAGERPALSDGGQRLTCRQLVDRAWELVAILRNNYSVGRDTPVALLAWSSPQAPALQLAIHHLGGRFVAIHPGSPVSEQTAFIGRCRCHLVVIEGPAFTAAGCELRRDLPEGTSIVSLDPVDGFDWLGSDARDFGELPKISDTFSTVFYTGGTAGCPKPVLQGPLFYQMVLQVAAWSAGTTRGDDRDLVCTPLTHGSGQMSVIVSLFGGAAIEARRGGSGEELLEVIESREITRLFLFPAKLRELLVTIKDSSWARPDRLRRLTYGGAPTSIAEISEARRILCPEQTQVYGLTEATMVTVLSPQDHRATIKDRQNSCGRPIPSMECQVRDHDGRTAPGVAGEVFVRGPFVTLGYLDALGDLMPLPDGWCRTGDIGRFDGEGFLYLLDRAKDVIITGETSDAVYCHVLEDHLSSVEAIAEAAVIGVPDRLYGESVRAFLVPRPGRSVNLDTLNEAITRSMGDLYRLGSVEICDSLPLTSLGKIDKSALRARFWPYPEQRFLSRHHDGGSGA